MSDREKMNGSDALPSRAVVQERPEAVPSEWIERLAVLSSTIVADVTGVGNVMADRIRPLAGSMRFCGQALTVKTKPGDALFPVYACELVRPGDVVVIDAQGSTEAAVLGEFVVLEYQRKGAVGAVVDGAIRDADEIIEAGFPLFAAGRRPHVNGAEGPGEINTPVSCGGIEVRPGDVILADGDGVVVVPKDQLETIVLEAEKKQALEEEWSREVAKGRSIVHVSGVGEKVSKLLRNSVADEDAAIDHKRTTTKLALTDALVERMLQRAVAFARENGGAYSIAVVDDGGNLKGFRRMDGAPLVSIQVAQDKAYTAVGFGLDTDQWYEFIKNDEPLRLGAPTGIPRLVPFGGGMAIRVNGEIVGGIGVSGGHYSDDQKVAQAALDVVHT